MKPFGDSGAFCPAGEGGGLRTLAVRAAGVTVLSQACGFVIQMAATIILARLLGPGDFGLLTMVMTFSLLFMNFGLNGFTEAVLQREEMDHSLASNVFWINAAIGVVLTIAFAAAGPFLATLYGDPRVAPVAAVMSATILLSSLSVQHLALLKRAMRFTAVSANDLLARTASVIVSIVLGWAGWGYWSLVGGALALAVTACAGAWTMCRWIPGRPRPHPGTGPTVRFALNTYGRFAATYCTWNLDNLLLGWRFGPVSLGYYKKAYDLFVLPMNQLSSPLTAVAVSSLSRLGSMPAQQKNYLLRALATLAFIGMGLGASLTLIGRDLVLLLLGAQWGESGRIFTFFGPGIGVMLLYATNGWIHLSIGRADRWFRWGIVELAVTGVLFVLALPHGPAGIAIAWVVSYSLLVIPALRYAGRPIDLGATEVIAVVWKFVAASALAGVATASLLQSSPALAGIPGASGALARLALALCLFGFTYVFAVALLHRGFEPFHGIARLLSEMLPAHRWQVRPARP